MGDVTICSNCTRPIPAGELGLWLVVRPEGTRDTCGQQWALTLYSALRRGDRDPWHPLTPRTGRSEHLSVLFGYPSDPRKVSGPQTGTEDAA